MRRVLALTILVSAVFVFSAPNAQAAACCDKKVGSCTGAEFMSVPNMSGAQEPTCGCSSSEYPTFVGCTPQGAGCCKKYSAPKQKTCEELAGGGATGNFNCIEASKNCDSGWTQNPDGYCPPDGAKKCCIKASAPKPAGTAEVKKAAPIPPLANPLCTVLISELLGRVANAFLGIAGSVALLMFVFGGLTWITSGGSPEKIQKGKTTMLWAIIGIAFIFSSYAILSYLLRVFGK